MDKTCQESTNMAIWKEYKKESQAGAKRYDIPNAETMMTENIIKSYMSSSVDFLSNNMDEAKYYEKTAQACASII